MPIHYSSLFQSTQGSGDNYTSWLKQNLQTPTFRMDMIPSLGTILIGVSILMSQGPYLDID